ncbi:MAG: GNAT family N-acetyltransferase [Balneola sp.]|nr:MAG: GNAT family N-acetyltransferase [Balneola sp.]
MPEIKEVLSSELKAYKILVRKGFVEAEDSFRITPEDDKPEGFPTKNTKDSFTIGAYDGDQLIGVASFRREGENRRKLRHKGLLFRIYVDPNYRKQGLAGQMIQEIIDRVKLLEDIEQINLTVIPTNAHAKKLYEKFGFVTYGSEKKAIKWKSRYFDEDQMQLMLRR